MRGCGHLTKKLRKVVMMMTIIGRVLFKLGFFWTVSAICFLRALFISRNKQPSLHC